MHDPMVVAFEIRRPWPKRGSPTPKKRWDVKFNSAFWTLAGRRYYFPSLVTVWHVEPEGRDSGEVCKHYVRWQDEDGQWRSKITNSWRWHVHHWKIQVAPLQHLRRWALTRCEWCGRPSRKGDVVNFSSQWDRRNGHWWQGERGLFHEECQAIEAAHRTCVCDIGPWESTTGGQPYGLCANCGRYRGWRQTDQPLGRQASAVLGALPQGSRDPEALKQARELWAQQREFSKSHPT